MLDMQQKRTHRPLPRQAVDSPNGSSDQQRRSNNNNVGFEPKIVNPLMPQEEKDAASNAKDGEDTENPPI